MFPLTLDLIDFLLDEPAEHALAEFTRADLSQQAELRTLTALRQRFSPDQAAALLDQARLRERASGKFPQADRLLFVDDALQQASSRAVAVYRAQQMVAFLSDSGEQEALAGRRPGLRHRRGHDCPGRGRLACPGGRA